jgi:hypothetical protein
MVLTNVLGLHAIPLQHLYGSQTEHWGPTICKTSAANSVKPPTYSPLGFPWPGSEERTASE